MENQGQAFLKEPKEDGEVNLNWEVKKQKTKNHHTLGAGPRSDTVRVPVGVGSRQEEAQAGGGGLDFSECQGRVMQGRV